MTSAELLTQIETYARAVSLSGATVTGRAVNNSRLYGRLVAGRSCTLDVAERIRAYMADNPPPVPQAAE